VTGIGFVLTQNFCTLYEVVKPGDIMTRQNISSGSPMEKPIGFSRAVRVGPHISVSGTAAILEDGSTACIDDVYGQTKCCIQIMKNAIEEAGGSLNDVMRTKLLLTDISKWEEAA